MKNRTNFIAYLSVSFVNVLWGLSFIASKHALQNGFQPFSLAAVRFVSAAVCLVPILWAREGLKFPKKDFRLLFTSALFGITFYFLFEYMGLKYTSASTASLIIAAIPAFTLLYGVFFRHRKYGKICYLGVVLSLFGVFLIVRFGATGGQDSLLGNLLILGACVCWVGYIEMTDALLKRRSSLFVTTWQAIFGGLTLLPCMLFEKTDWARVTPSAWGMAFYLAIFCSVIAYLLYVDVVGKLEPLKTALFINLNPLAAVLGGVLLLNETLSPMQLLGGAVVLASIFLVSRQK